MKVKFLLLILLALMACEQRPSSTQGGLAIELISKVLPQVIDSIQTTNDFGGRSVIIVNEVDNNLDSLMLEETIAFLDDPSDFDRAVNLLADRLIQRLSALPTLNFEQLNKQGKYQFLDGTTDGFSYDHLNPEFLGPSTVTPIELDEDKKLGIFYADLHCGEDCGGGYLVIFMHIDGVWELVEMLELWNVKLPYQHRV